MSIGDLIAVRNYAAGPKWVPATIQQPNGLVSFRCGLDDGREVRRYQNKVIAMGLPHNSRCVPSTNKPMPSELTGPPVTLQNNSGELPRESDSAQLPQVTISSDVPTPALSKSVAYTPVVYQVFRHSTRARKPVDKLNL